MTREESLNLKVNSKFWIIKYIPSKSLIHEEDFSIALRKATAIYIPQLKSHDVIIYSDTNSYNYLEIFNTSNEAYQALSEILKNRISHYNIRLKEAESNIKER
jgi:hypothetical protein